ncbi:MarR family transcriptional regulator [Thermobifida halotolerans]|uniref:MarR family transcriptional regulator n=1 Tax=Thermobifida halotolerans TaxID=483545 RepID=A0A399FYW1_9ACTN|nr:MarR family transcriptional regulator [Thermobifida halotolerans]UOE19422.1 MarR family transcriptional regulator [Thermobifida halotolerans]
MERSDAEFAEFSHAWGELVRAVARARGRAQATTEPGLTLAQALLLETAVGVGHPTVGEIAHAAGISSPSATRMLQQLERKGMVRRRRSEEDERATVVTVTEEGMRALDAHQARVRARLHDLFQEVEPRLRPVLIELLHTMRDLTGRL